MVKNTVLGTITGRLKQMTPEGLKAPIRTWLHSQRASRSQAGQDIWVSGEVFDGMEHGFFLDIGAYDGIELSNSYLLETRYGWRGICVEANPESFALLRRNRSAVCVNACLGAGDGHATFALDGMFGGIVSAQPDRANGSRPETLALPTISLARLLRENDAPREMDYLSIDIEGAEEQVLTVFPFDQYRFNCMTIERPPAALRHLLSTHGYRLIKDIPGLDCFYVHSGFLDRYATNMIAHYAKKYLTIPMG